MAPRAIDADAEQHHPQPKGNTVTKDERKALRELLTIDGYVPWDTEDARVAREEAVAALPVLLDALEAAEAEVEAFRFFSDEFCQRKETAEDAAHAMYDAVVKHRERAEAAERERDGRIEANAWLQEHSEALERNWEALVEVERRRTRAAESRAATARAEALDEAAALCERPRCRTWAPEECAMQIRALIPAKEAHPERMPEAVSTEMQQAARAAVLPLADLVRLMAEQDFSGPFRLFVDFGWTVTIERPTKESKP